MSRLDRFKQVAQVAGAPITNPFLIAPTLDTARSRPRLTSTVRHIDKLDDAFDTRLEKIKPGAKAEYDVSYQVPQGETVLERVKQVLDKPGKYAGSTAPGKSPGININPNSDRAAYAHELGHILSQQTDIGNFVATLRANPHLKNALLTSMLVGSGAGLASAIEEGNEDLDTSLAVAALASAPTMIDEGLATKNALAIMDTAGMRASLGQRGKLASGLLSYMAAPVLAATAGNVVGNLLD